MFVSGWKITVLLQETATDADVHAIESRARRSVAVQRVTFTSIHGEPSGSRDLLIDRPDGGERWNEPSKLEIVLFGGDGGADLTKTLSSMDGVISTSMYPERVDVRIDGRDYEPTCLIAQIPTS